MKEIVGARIGTLLTTNIQHIIAAVEMGTLGEWLDRRRLEFMAACDVGSHWEAMARAKTLFRLGDSGEVLPP